MVPSAQTVCICSVTSELNVLMKVWGTMFSNCSWSLLSEGYISYLITIIVTNFGTDF